MSDTPKAFACYRLPYADTYTRIEQLDGTPENINNIEDTVGKSGFLVAPFHQTHLCPTLLIRADRKETLAIPPEAPWTDEAAGTASTEQDARTYTEAFIRFHQALTDGRFNKLVLSRCLEIPNGYRRNTEGLFAAACHRYPRMFIALVSAPQCGTWFVTTPELLLENEGDRWHTIALAGTMKATGQPEWSAKNIEEQRYVSRFIADALRPFSDDCTEEGPYTARAGHLIHLRSDFHFSLRNHETDRHHTLGRLLRTLHPTPAVCGLPKEEAFRFILDNEPTPRRYYSGFMGPFCMPETHLFVSLRCMEITDTRYRLYAGGGLLKDSVGEQEWQETEIKLDTIRNLLGQRASDSDMKPSEHEHSIFSKTVRMHPDHPAGGSRY